MIGKGASISHTKASMEYGWNNEKDANVVLKNNLIGNNPSEITKEFEMIQSLNNNCNKNTLSFVLSPTIEDGKNLLNKDFNKIANDFIKEMELGDRQAIAFVHNDKEHRHIHLYVNRINFNGIAYNDSYIGKKCHKSAHNVAIKNNLRTVKDIQNSNKLATKEIRSEIRDIHLQVLTLKRPQNFEEYINQMKKQGVTVNPIINKSNQLQGFRYLKDGYNFKGSEVHRSMSINKIAIEINSNSEIGLRTYPENKNNNEKKYQENKPEYNETNFTYSSGIISALFKYENDEGIIFNKKRKKRNKNIKR